MNTEIIVAVLGAFATIFTVVITNFITRRNQLKFEERKLKEVYYTNYIKAISNNVLLKGHDGEIEDAQNRLLLVGSSEVVDNLMKFHNGIKPSALPITSEEHDMLLTDLIKAMRKDLYDTKKVNCGYPVIHLSGKSSYNHETRRNNETKI